jgi:ferrous iron transport protein B
MTTLPPTDFSCHRPESAPANPGAISVALVGLPNTGKSTLFNRLTGGNAHIANWPGLTVDLQRGTIRAGRDGRPWDVVDLPGIHDLSGGSEDEAIVQRFLTTTPPDLLVVVVNASQIASQLRLVLQLGSVGLPMVLALNMSDEAPRFGVAIDTEALAQELGYPVVAISARHQQGLAQLLDAMRTVAHGSLSPKQVPGQLEGEALDARQAALIERCVRSAGPPRNRRTRNLDKFLLHPLVGPVLFLAIVLAMFQAIYALGAPLQELMGTLVDGFAKYILSPLLVQLGTPDLLQQFLIDGVWMGVGTVFSFLPIIFIFYFVMALVEDSGYLPRAAFLMDGFMHWLGLDGRAFVLQVMGFGCNVPAIMGTRVIRDRGMRLLAIMVIPFALCQARLTVFIFMAGIFFPRPWWAPGLVVFGFYLLSFVAAIITALIFKRTYPSREAFVLELPPYRRPSLRTMLKRAWMEVGQFAFTTRRFIVLGAALVWLLTHLPAGAAQGGQATAAQWIGQLFQPLLGPIGMNPDLTVTLFFGFIAKEILLGAMAVVYRTSETNLGNTLHAAITPLQALSFMTFTLLYTPCLSTVAVQIREAKSRLFALRSIAWSLALAWLMAFLVYRGGRLWFA